MAAARPGVSRNVNHKLGSPLICRHRGLTRRKRSSSFLAMASFSAASGGGGGGGGGGSRRVTTSPSASGAMPSWGSTSSFGNSDQRPEEASSDMLVDDKGGAGGGGGGAAKSKGSSAFSRLLTEPAVECDTRSDPGAGLGNISSARGVTMDFVHGAVRSKTPPVTLADPVVSPVGMRSMVDLAAAVEEAAAQRPAVSPNHGQLAAELRTGLAEENPAERTYRAATSAAFFSPLDQAGSSGPKSKRARSGVSVMNAGASPGVGKGEPIGWLEDSRLTPVNSASGRGEGAAALGTAAPGPDGSAAETVGEEGGGVAANSLSSAPAPEPLTNEAWLAQLSPLLRNIAPSTHPEDFLHDILRERGYSTEMVAVKDTVFFRPPEPSQVAAYDKAILRAVLDEDEEALERMRASGRRMDCCNRFGDSVLHMSCRRGRVGTLRYLLRVCDGGVLLSDDFGRTIMHDACWTATPRFDVASAVLDVDTRLLRCLDSRGSSPLQYVPQDQWPLWCAFFERRKEIYWPHLAPGEDDVAGEIPLSEGASSVE